MATLVESQNHWKELFQRWPAEMTRHGVIVVTFGEQIPFTGFSASDGFLLVERQTPDTMSARTVIIPYESIAALKIVDVVKPRLFQELGFAFPQRH